MHPIITSTHNPKIKNILSLAKARERKKQGMFTIEGFHEVSMAIQAGYNVSSIFYCEELIAHEKLKKLADERLFIPVAREVFNKLVVRENSGGVIAIASSKAHTLENIVLGSNPLLLVLEAVEKPGNLGAILRIADAARLDAVIICDPQTDFYNPNVIRSSVGCVFSTQLISTSSKAMIAWLKSNKIKIATSYLGESVPYHTFDFTEPSAIVMGTEATGVTEDWVAASDKTLIIPMQGNADSLNVSSAAAILVFEACRQRNFSFPGK